MRSGKPASAAWTWRHAIARSELSPTTRHVLLTLSIFMDEAGQSCYPSIEDMVAATGLSKRAVLTHLAKACEYGWLSRKLHGFGGQKWKRLEYEAVWPGREVDTTAGGEEREQPQEGSERGAPPLEKAVNVGFEGSEGRSPKAVKDVHRGKEHSIHQSSTTPEDSRESTRARENEASPESASPTFDALCVAWTQGAIGGPGAIGDATKAVRAILALDPDDRAMAVERAPRFLRSIKDAKRSYTMSIESYVHGRQFVHHPPPANVDPAAIQPITLKPYVKELWAMFWKAIHRARQATGDDRHIRRLRDCTDWLERGVTTAAVTLPSADDLASLVPIKIDEAEHLAWQDYTTRIGARLPKPDHVPVIYVPAAWPPPLTLAGTKPYRLALPVRIEVRSPAWWWRFFKSIEDGAPIVSTLAGRHRVDLLEPARRSAGAQEVDYGPIPLASEISAMVEVRPLTNAFEQWSTWIAVRGGDLAMWPHGPIFCPTEFPTLIFAQDKQRNTEGAAA